MPDRTGTVPRIAEYLEREVKFSVPTTFVLPDDVTGDHHSRYDGRRMLRATYYDTEDLRLARNGITLRYRTGEGQPVWTLKVPATSGVSNERIERSVPGPAEPVAPALASLVLAHTRFAPLIEVARLTTRRDAWLLLDTDGAVAAELVDDAVSVVKAGRVSSRFREIEIEHKGQPGADETEPPVAQAVRSLTAAGATPGGFSSKLGRALGPRASAPPEVPAPARVGKHDLAGATIARLVRSGVRRLISLDIGVRLGKDDAVHQMRVACRRLRSDLRTFVDLFEPGSTDELRAELAWLADSLGAARDLEVLRVRLVKTAASDPLAPLDDDVFRRLDEVFQADERTALEQVGNALGSERYLRLLDLAVRTAQEPRLTDAARYPAREVFPLLLARCVAELDKTVRKLSTEASDATWHAARIRAKRARYAAEATVDVLGKKARRTASAMADVQGVLGDHQDAAVAAETLVAIAHRSPQDVELVLLCGRLAERERASIGLTRRRFPPAWKNACSPAARGWLPTARSRKG